MGYIKEPEGVDFVIESSALSLVQEQEISEYITKRKQEHKKLSKKGSNIKK